MMKNAMVAALVAGVVAVLAGCCSCLAPTKACCKNCTPGKACVCGCGQDVCTCTTNCACAK